MAFNMASQLAGRGFLVTGGTKGIGRAVVDSLVDSGAVVVTCARNTDTAVRRDNLLPVTCDISNSAERAALIDTATDFMVQRGTSLSGLINNVGTNVRKPTIEYSAEEVTALMETNFDASFHLTQLAYPHLVAAREGRDGKASSVVNVSSVSGGPTCTQTGSVYAASKGALNAFTKYTACEWGQDGVRVNAVAPWYIATPLVEAVLEHDDYKKAVLHRTPMRRTGLPEEVASAILFLASDYASYVTGTVLHVDGGFASSGFGFFPEFEIPSLAPKA